MDNEKIMDTTRSALGLPDIGNDFDGELVLHISASLSVLTQNGIGKPDFVFTPDKTWGDFKDSESPNNLYFNLIPMFVFTRTKILFDPPPPSNVEFYNGYIQELLWRIKQGYGT